MEVTAAEAAEMKVEAMVLVVQVYRIPLSYGPRKYRLQYSLFPSDHYQLDVHLQVHSTACDDTAVDNDRNPTAGNSSRAYHRRTAIVGPWSPMKIPVGDQGTNCCFSSFCKQ